MDGYFAYLGSLMGLIAILDRIIPRQVWILIDYKLRRFRSWVSWYTEVTIDEIVSNNSNEIYELADLHIASLTASRNSSRRIHLSQVKNASVPSYKPASGEPIDEKFQGVIFYWELKIQNPPGGGGGGYFSFYDKSGGVTRKYQLSVHQRHKYTLLPLYLDHVLRHGRILRHKVNDRQIFTNIRSQTWEYRNKLWCSVPFKHASTFDSIALSAQTRSKIMDDLSSFMEGEEFFNRIGRAWKRGYLLYGPPGTGKSSLIAAIANYTQYDVYDLELTEVTSNANLRQLLMGITSKSIIVIEDIDCSLELQKRGKSAPAEKKEDDKPPKKKEEDNEKSRVTLSGLLNFIDGLWSCIGSERIIIFTTNHRNKLDPALLRPGRMDLHILLSYCCFEAFKILAFTHLGIQTHDSYDEIEGLIPDAKIIPADVAEVLIQNRGDADLAMEMVIEALKDPKRKAKEEEREAEEEKKQDEDLPKKKEDAIDQGLTESM